MCLRAYSPHIEYKILCQVQTKWTRGLELRVDFPKSPTLFKLDLMTEKPFE